MNYDELIEIQYPVITQNDIGEPVQTWKHFGYDYAVMKQLGSREAKIADKPTLVISTQFEIRWRPSMTSEKRIVRMVNNQVCNIKDIRDEGPKAKTITILCQTN